MPDNPVAGRVWWQRPRLRDDQERAVGWLELFFDLVFVAVISRLAADLAETHTLRGVIEFGLQFIGVFWAWNAFTYYTERFETEGLQDRLLTLVSMMPVAALAIYARGGLGSNYRGFTLAYLAARMVNMVEWARAARHVAVFRPVATTFIAGFAVVAAIMVAGLFVRGDARLILFAVAVLADVATPSLTVRQQEALPAISRSRFPERFGTLTMIVLGESVVGVILSLSTLDAIHPLSGRSLAAGALSIAIGFGLWWVYFDFIARRPPRPAVGSVLGWVYMHLVALTAITVTGAALSVTVTNQAHGHLPDSSRWLLSAGVGLALMSLAWLETTVDRTEDEPTHPVVSPGLKVGGGLVAVGLGCAPIGWRPLSLLSLLLVVLAVQATYGAVVWYRQQAAAAQ